jgi:hypothetical protein
LEAAIPEVLVRQTASVETIAVKEISYSMILHTEASLTNTITSGTQSVEKIDKRPRQFPKRSATLARAQGFVPLQPSLL